jgi:hypothetical protein
MLNGADGISDIEGEATRVGASDRGQGTSFNPLALTAAFNSIYHKPLTMHSSQQSLLSFELCRLHERNGADGISDIEGKVARVSISECGQRASFNNFGAVALPVCA